MYESNFTKGDLKYERFQKISRNGMAIMLGLGSPIGNFVMNDLGYAVTAEAAGKVALSSRKTSVWWRVQDHLI